MYYIGYDFNHHKFCITKKEKNAIHYSSELFGTLVNTFDTYEEKDAALARRDYYNKVGKITEDDVQYQSNTGKVFRKIVKCKECGHTFIIPHTEIDFFESKNLPLPRRCPPCRQKRKQEREGKK